MHSINSCIYCSDYKDIEFEIAFIWYFILPFFPMFLANIAFILNLSNWHSNYLKIGYMASNYDQIARDKDLGNQKMIKKQTLIIKSLGFSFVGMFSV